jgi:hypothetical protein
MFIPGDGQRGERSPKVSKFTPGANFIPGDQVHLEGILRLVKTGLSFFNLISIFGVNLASRENFEHPCEHTELYRRTEGCIECLDP